MQYFEIKCPCCNTILVIDRIDGKVIEERRPILEQSSGDRFKDALIKSKQQKVTIEKKFKNSENDHKKRSESLQNIFDESLKKIKESDDKSKPLTTYHANLCRNTMVSKDFKSDQVSSISSMAIFSRTPKGLFVQI